MSKFTTSTRFLPNVDHKDLSHGGILRDRDCGEFTASDGRVFVLHADIEYESPHTDRWGDLLTGTVHAVTVRAMDEDGHGFGTLSLDDRQKAREQAWRYAERLVDDMDPLG